MATGGEPARLDLAVGAAVMVLGAALRVWSLRALGRGFSRDVQVTQDQQLVTGAPYRWLRHPSYTGALLLFGGLGIAQANAVSILVLTVLPVMVYLFDHLLQRAPTATMTMRPRRIRRPGR